MSDKTFVGQSLHSIEVAPAFDPISKVVIITGTASDGTQSTITVGNDTGRTLEFENPWGTAAMANAILTQLNGYAYQPYTARGALLDPAAELGDGVTVNGVYSAICTSDLHFAGLMSTDISAPADEEIDHEYPYEDAADRSVARRMAKNTEAILSVVDDEISAIVVSSTATFRQNTIPENASAGDLWYVTDDVSVDGHNGIPAANSAAADSEAVDGVKRNYTVGDWLLGKVTDGGTKYYRVYGDVSALNSLKPFSNSASSANVFIVSQNHVIYGVQNDIWCAYLGDYAGRFSTCAAAQASVLTDIDNSLYSAYRMPGLLADSIGWATMSSPGSQVLDVANSDGARALKAYFIRPYEKGKWYRYNGSVWELCEDTEVVETVSSLTVSVGEIRSEVSQKTDSATVQSMIDQTFDDITLSVSNSATGGYSRISLKLDGVTIATSGNINLGGDVVFTSNLTDGTTTISGDNITTGTIDASDVAVTNIEADNITTGTLDADLINLTGQFTVQHHGYDYGYIGCGIGSTGSTPTYGAYMSDSTGENYFIATQGGVRMQADTTTCYLTPGGAWVTGGVWNSASDRRLKRDIDYDMSKYVDLFDGLRPCSFRMIANDKKEWVGMIAQDVIESLKESGIDPDTFVGLAQDEDGYYGLGYTAFIPVLVAKVQQQQKRIDDLEARLTKLESLVNGGT